MHFTSSWLFLTAISVCFPIAPSRLNAFFMQRSQFSLQFFSPIGLFIFTHLEFLSWLHTNLNWAAAKLPKVHLPHPDKQKKPQPNKKRIYSSQIILHIHGNNTSMEMAVRTLPHPGQCCRISVKFPISQDIKFDCKEIQTSCNLTPALERS